MLPRRTALLALGPALILAACASTPPQSFAPLRYDYLPPLRLNVATVDVDDHWQPLSSADVGRESFALPGPTLAQMGRDRLKPAGGTGRAVFTVDDASLIQNGDVVNGSFAVHLDIIGPDGARVGYAEARVVRQRSGIAGSGNRRASQLYDLVKQMMDVMNVELEYQVRQKLGTWLVGAAPAAVPAPVTQQELPAPGQ
jgi:hypothetical protein